MCVFRKSGGFSGVFFEKAPYFFTHHPIFHPVFHENTYFFAIFRKKSSFCMRRKAENF